MKEIGEQFKEKREEIGITIEEVSNDLSRDVIVIQNLENGNHKVFRDILDLKDMVRIYAKYLGLDDEKLLEELDDFIFEKTSKISAIDVENKLKEEQEKKKDDKKIHTPYTLELKNQKDFTVVVIIIIIVFLLALFYILLKILFS
ncbi:MAG: helix-turn-helix domain-containing protein [Bacilli bacterium]|nr:helix-turn-helix domain-containing protein [Bacilli bacterium]